MNGLSESFFDALIAIDVQPTFMPVAVCRCRAVMKSFGWAGAYDWLANLKLRFATQDWHPRGHISGLLCLWLPPYTLLTEAMVAG